MNPGVGSEGSGIIGQITCDCQWSCPRFIPGCTGIQDNISGKGFGSGIGKC